MTPDREFSPQPKTRTAAKGPFPFRKGGTPILPEKQSTRRPPAQQQTNLEPCPYYPRQSGAVWVNTGGALWVDIPGAFRAIIDIIQ